MTFFNTQIFSVIQYNYFSFHQIVPSQNLQLFFLILNMAWRTQQIHNFYISLCYVYNKLFTSWNSINNLSFLRQHWSADQIGILLRKVLLKSSRTFTFYPCRTALSPQYTCSLLWLKLTRETALFIVSVNLIFSELKIEFI